MVGGEWGSAGNKTSPAVQFRRFPPSNLSENPRRSRDCRDVTLTDRQEKLPAAALHFIKGNVRVGREESPLYTSFIGGLGWDLLFLNQQNERLTGPKCNKTRLMMFNCPKSRFNQSTIMMNNISLNIVHS